MVENRIFAYIDILGFKKLVKKKGNDEIHATLKKFIESDNAKMNDFFEMISFSDTILVYAKETGFRTEFFDDITYFAPKLVIEMLQHGIPVRGVITYGELNIDMAENSNHKMFWGQGMIDAYDAESTENIIGIFVLPEALCGFRSIQELEKCFPSKYHVKYDDRVLINLFQRIAEVGEAYSLRDAIKDFDPQVLDEIVAYFHLKQMASEKTGKVADKYRNTFKLLDIFISHRLEEMQHIYNCFYEYEHIYRELHDGEIA